MDWYDKQGNPLVTVDMDDPKWDEQMRAVEKLLSDVDYRVVKQEYTPNKKYWVSTVWVGLDQRYSGKVGQPVIFETMVFNGKRNNWYKRSDGTRIYHAKSYEQQRYCTEEEAIFGHNQLLTKYSKEK